MGVKIAIMAALSFTCPQKFGVELFVYLHVLQAFFTSSRTKGKKGIIAKLTEEVPKQAERSKQQHLTSIVTLTLLQNIKTPKCDFDLSYRVGVQYKP